MSDAAEAAITAPEPARIHAAVRRSPRNASQTAPGRRLRVGARDVPATTPRATPYATASTTPPTAAPAASATTVRRRSGATSSASAASASHAAPRTSESRVTRFATWARVALDLVRAGA